MIREGRIHRESDAERRADPAEVVMHVMQGDGVGEIVGTWLWFKWKSFPSSSELLRIRGSGRGWRGDRIRKTGICRLGGVTASILAKRNRLTKVMG
jgi:hypothetical protein